MASADFLGYAVGLNGGDIAGFDVVADVVAAEKMPVCGARSTRSVVMPTMSPGMPVVSGSRCLESRGPVRGCAPCWFRRDAVDISPTVKAGPHADDERRIGR